MAEYKKPSLPGSSHFEGLAAGHDPAELSAAGHRIANLLVRGALDSHDRDLVERVIHLADEEGLGVIAELWAHAAPTTLAGALWRLYVLRTWVNRQPDLAAQEFATGKSFAPVEEFLAGVDDPPGPPEVIALFDTVIRGIMGANFDVVLDRAAAFAHIVGIGRGQREDGDPVSGARLLDTAAALHRAAELERAGLLH